MFDTQNISRDDVRFFVIAPTCFHYVFFILQIFYLTLRMKGSLPNREKITTIIKGHEYRQRTAFAQINNTFSKNERVNKRYWSQFRLDLIQVETHAAIPVVMNFDLRHGYNDMRWGICT